MAVKLGFLGPEGTFSAMAARHYASVVGSKDIHYEAFRTIAEVLLGVEDGRADRGVVPAENSIEGSVAVTLDYLVHEVQLTIMGEVVVPVRHHLLALPGVELSDVTTVLSHPQALAQCRHHLANLLPQAEQRSSNSTAEAARWVKTSGNRNSAAIGTELAGQLYELAVLHGDMQDTDRNATRFLIVGHEKQAPTGNDKTSVVFAFAADQPGNLFRALKQFASRGINLTKLESRPAKRDLGDYIFFADLAGHETDTTIAEALTGLRTECSFVRVLGSYPLAQ